MTSAAQQPSRPAPKVWSVSLVRNEIDIVDAAKQALDSLSLDGVPTYVRRRLVHVQRLPLGRSDPVPPNVHVVGDQAVVADGLSLVTSEGVQGRAKGVGVEKQAAMVDRAVFSVGLAVERGHLGQ